MIYLKVLLHLRLIALSDISPLSVGCNLNALIFALISPSYNIDG